MKATRKNAKPKKQAKSWVAWAGFVEGRPYIEEVSDTYGDARRFEMFPSEGRARERFQDVRRVRVTEEP